MQRAMDRLTSFLERRRWVVLGTWIVLLIASLPFMMRQTEHLTSGGFSIPGSGSEAVDKGLVDFSLAQREALSVVVARRPGTDAADVRRELRRVDRLVDAMPLTAIAPGSLARAEADAAKSPVAIAAIQTGGDMNDIAEVAADLRKELGIGEAQPSGVETHLVGEAAMWAGMQDLSKEDLAKAESAGFPIVLLILLAVFGSLVAASMPLALGFLSVAITGAGIFFLSQQTEMSVFVTNVASMIGIGVAVDYSLFILARYREEIWQGAAPEEARRIAMRTSGVAVAFSGITVILSLAGLFLVDSTVLRSMAMGAVLVVAVSILGALTFLPALMAVAGRRGYVPGRTAGVLAFVVRRVRGLRRRPSLPAGTAVPSFWQRWTDRVTRRPVLTVVLSAGLMLVLAIPALSLKTGDGALRQFPAGNETRVGAELAADKLGPGASGPVEVLAKFSQGKTTTADNREALGAFAVAVRKDREVVAAAPPVPSRDATSALVEVTPRHDAESAQARALVERLRDGTTGGDSLRSVADVEVGGATASVEDFRVQVSGSLWKIVLFVLAFSYVVLFVLLRSVLLPLKAVLMNLLSVGAAYGILVAIFQYGWIDGFLGFRSLGYINTMTPPLLLAMVFGLSMDYEVFLLSRIKERYAVSGDSKLAVAEGLARSAGTISSAALIMVAVFAVFAGVGVPSIKEIGVGLAVAIALDATVVRLVLVPATMEIMGRWNWWLPRPLDRILPEADFESSGIDAPARA
jgi:uncharacterized membrane protein YdfJ with MMPL/SSD domain